MGKLKLEEVLRELQPDLPPRKDIMDAWQQGGIKNIVNGLSRNRVLPKKRDVEEFRSNTYTEIMTSIEKINNIEAIWEKQSTGFRNRSSVLVDSLIGVIIGSVARFESESQSDIDINLVINEPPRIDSLRNYIEEFREDLRKECEKKTDTYLCLDTSHCKPFPLRTLKNMDNMANSIIGYHGLGDPTRLNNALRKEIRGIDKWKLIDHIRKRASNELKEEKHGPTKIWYTVMMYAVRMFALCFLDAQSLYTPFPKPYWKICDDLYSVRGVDVGILDQCSSAVAETVTYRYLEDREIKGGKEYKISQMHRDRVLRLVEVAFNQIQELIRLTRPHS
jgi:predicted nucleotidyltransferase